MSPNIEVAIPTWNRCDDVVRAVRSALAQDVPGLRVRVYDNGSTDGTPEVLRAEFGDRIEVLVWPENRGQAANTARIFRSDSDLLLMLFNDEELLPGGLRALVDGLAASPGSAFAYGTVTIRSASHRVLRPDALFGVDPATVPARRDGLDYIRETYRTGNHVWVCCTLFDLRVVRLRGFSDTYAPQGDSIMLMEAALQGPVTFVHREVATRTDGLAGEAQNTGLVGGATDGFDVPTVIGVLNYRLVFERFLHGPLAEHLDAAERTRLARSIERYTIGNAARTAVARSQSTRALIRQAREIAPWVRPWSARARLALDMVRARRSGPDTSAARVG